jgi:sterol desaturase/sphingolipid hydroxylase (fatty acid hydroxylase superfamily)
MHRDHQSIAVRETNSNFGFNFPWRDRLLETCRAQPEAGHEGMTIVIDLFRDRKELRLGRMLIQRSGQARETIRSAEGRVNRRRVSWKTELE